MVIKNILVAIDQASERATQHGMIKIMTLEKFQETTVWKVRISFAKVLQTAVREKEASYFCKQLRDCTEVQHKCYSILYSAEDPVLCKLRIFGMIYDAQASCLTVLSVFIECL